MFANPSLIGSLELLANGKFPANWIEIGPKGKWGQNETGGIIQKAVVGTRKSGGGTIQALKDPITSPIQELKLTCRPGSRHQVGVVFNLLDAKNFSVFCIDQHDQRTPGYDLVVFEVKEGDYNVISKESYEATALEVVTLALRYDGRHLQFFFNDAHAYTWSDMPLFGKKVGLYSYKNKDATFLSLSVFSLSTDPLAIAAKPVETQPVKPDEIIVSGPKPKIEPVPLVSSNGITGFLEIKKPASKTEIEFTEVFTVPLDSFYSSLYQNTDLDSSNQTGTSGVSEVQLLDLRVKRWYRDLKLVRENLAFAREDLIRNKARVDEAETQLRQGGVDEDGYAELERKLLERRAGYKNILSHVNNLRDQEGLVLREVRVNGYAVEENTTIDAIRALGYDFHLVGQAMARGEYDPAEFGENLELSNDDVWAASEKKLHQQLFDSGAITEKGASLYPREKDLLVNFEACPSLVEAAQQLEEDIERQEELKPLYEDVVKDMEAEVGEWEGDKVTLARQRDLYAQISNPYPWVPYYYLYIKQFFDKAVGWFDSLATPGSSNAPYPVHPSFQGSLLNSGKGRRMKLNRFMADVYTDFSEQPNLYITGWTQWTILQGLALYCPEIGINFYHRVETIYPNVFFDWTPNSRNEFGTDQNIYNFFNAAQQVCDYFLGKTNEKLEAAKLRVRELENKAAGFRHRLEDIQQNGLSRERLKFLEKWNDPATNMTAAIATTVHYPDEDPLAEFLASISGHSTAGSSPVETYFFAPTPDGFYNQNGLSLLEFMKNRPDDSTGRDVICVFPVFDPLGAVSGEMVKVVRNPHGSLKAPSLPKIKFVESYRMEVGWRGYGLGELSHSFNLFPGESKELVVEKSTKLKTKLEESRKTTEEVTSKLTFSFEDNLQKELSVGEKAAQESSSTAKQDSSQTSSSEETSSREANVEAKASGGLFGFSASVGGGSKWGSGSKRNSAFTASQSAEEKRASNQSKDILSKNVSNAVSKVASETSQNNKLEFSAVSSREYEESTSNREVIKLQNPNVGKTVNYNFFQVQNLYGVRVRLIDVQIVIDSGVEMAKGTNINDVRVHNLEEFGKIYANADQTDRAAALAAIVARQVIKHYGDFLPGVTSGNGAIGVRSGFNVDKEMVQVLNFSSEESEAALKDRINHIKTALDYLKGVPFQFREAVLSEETTVAVNCAAYHVESQLGFLQATEPYLEDRREIETEKQRALVEHVKAQTKAGVFYQELPDGITSLNLSAPKSAEQKDKST